MAAPAALTLEDARIIATQYGLSVLRLEPVPGGRVNSNFRLWTAQGESLFMRVYDQQDATAVEEELRLVRELARVGVPTPSALARADGVERCDYLGKPVALFPWIHGRWVCQRSVTPERCWALGAELGRLHRATRLCHRAPEGRFGPKDLERRLDTVSASRKVELRSAAVLVRRLLDAYAAERDDELPGGIIHGDLFRENVLWARGHVAALVDFECACHGPFAYDLMICVLAWCYGSSFEWPLVRAVLEGYASQRTLSLREVRALAREGALACLRFATTRLSDFSLGAGPEGPKRDYRRFLRRLADLEAGASRELTELATRTRRASDPLAAQQDNEP